MKRELFFLLMLSISIWGCKEPLTEQTFNLVDSISGQWKVEKAILDGIEIDSWNQMVMTIDLEEDSINVKSVNQANGKDKIWPDNTKWLLTSTNETTSGTFIRNDNTPLLIFLNEEELHISLHPPRDWSYEEDCPNDNSELICKEEGQWFFEFTYQGI